MSRLWNPSVKLATTSVSLDDYKYSVAELAEIIYNYLCRLHNNKDQNISTATNTLTTKDIVKKDGSDG